MYKKSYEDTEFTDITLKDIDWVKGEFEQMSVNDERITKSTIRIAQALAKQPNKSIPEACNGWNNTKTAYRLFDNLKMNPEVMCSGHRQETVDRIKFQDKVLIIQDTTSLNFSDHPNTEGINLYSTSQTAKGILLHTALAVSTKGVPLGILNQAFWTRAPKDKTRNYKELPTEEKESQKWFNAIDKSLEGIPDNILAITVCDREADIYEFFLKGITENKNILARACKDRRIVGKNKLLVSEVENQPIGCEVIINIPRNTKDNHPEREARCTIQYCQVTIKPPKNHPNIKELSNINLTAVLLKEISKPPKGVKAVYWLLLTTLPVTSPEEALEVIQWYKQRWKIERYHLALKSGCKVEELQLETFERLQNAIAIYSVIAWKLLWLTYEARENPDASCEKVLKKYEWQALYCFANKTSVPPKAAPSLKDAVLLLAKLGGFLARKNDGEPGIIVIWRGLSRLNDIAEAWRIARSPDYSTDVGNA